MCLGAMSHICQENLFILDLIKILCREVIEGISCVRFIMFAFLCWE